MLLEVVGGALDDAVQLGGPMLQAEHVAFASSEIAWYITDLVD